MSPEQQQVLSFHQALQREEAKAGRPRIDGMINHTPTIPPKVVCDLRLDLIREELIELADAFIELDTVKVADALADLMYVVLGAGICCGIDLEPVFREVHRSNMTKFIDGSFRVDGKYLKGPSYSKPNIKAEIEKQRMTNTYESNTH